jgi:DNA-binding XRE family transcriptional regulator
MVTKMLRDDRRRWGLTEAQAARRFGVSLRAYRSFEAGEAAPNYATYERICALFGWPQTYVKRGT